MLSKQEDMSSCSTMRHVFLFNNNNNNNNNDNNKKKTCLLAEQEDMSSRATRRHVFLLSKKTRLRVQQEDMSSCYGMFTYVAQWLPKLRRCCLCWQGCWTPFVVPPSFVGLCPVWRTPGCCRCYQGGAAMPTLTKRNGWWHPCHLWGAWAQPTISPQRAHNATMHKLEIECNMHTYARGNAVPGHTALKYLKRCFSKWQVVNNRLSNLMGVFDIAYLDKLQGLLPCA